jgi:peptide/nickel transport system substrate-binding protein
MSLDNYWSRKRLTRRTVVRSAGATALGAGALAITGCGDDDDDGAQASPGGGGLPTPASNVSPSVAAKQPKRGGQVSMIMAEPANISVFTASAGIPQHFGYAHNRLTRLKTGPGIDPADVTLEADLAEALPEQPDDLTYIYKIRSGIKFHDIAPANGREMTAEDVKFAIDGYRSDTRSGMRGDNSAIESVTVTSGNVVTVKTKQPHAPLLPISSSGYGWRIFPKEQLDGESLKTQPIGTGPYVMESYQPNSKAEWKRNPTYFRDGLPYLDRLTFLSIPQLPQQVAAFEAGTLVQLVQVDPTTAKPLQDKGAKFMQSFISFPGGYIAVNNTAPPFNDPRVRRALSMALDRQAEIRTFEGGVGKPDQIVPVGAYKDALPIDQLGESAKYWQFNTAESKKLLEAAGYPDGVETTVVWTPQYGASSQGALERALPEFRAAGFKLTAQSIQYADWIAGIYRPPFNFPGMMWGPYRTYPDIDPYIWYWLHPDPKEGISNQSRTNDPALTAMLEKQRRTLNKQERVGIVHDIQRLVADQQYYIGRTTGAAFTLWQPWIEGWTMTLGYDWNFIERAWDSRL